ncbi:MAG: flagellar export chaperone FliS, partial [Bryobacteraceae bacterium]
MSAYGYNAYDTYLEQKILGASPLELVRILYHASLDSVRAARRHLAAGDIAARSAQIDRATRILLELTSSVDCV